MRLRNIPDGEHDTIDHRTPGSELFKQISRSDLAAFISLLAHQQDHTAESTRFGLQLADCKADSVSDCSATISGVRTRQCVEYSIGPGREMPNLLDPAVERYEHDFAF